MMNIIGILTETVGLVFGLARFGAFIVTVVFGTAEDKAETLVDKWMKTGK